MGLKRKIEEYEGNILIHDYPLVYVDTSIIKQKGITSVLNQGARAFEFDP